MKIMTGLMACAGLLMLAACNTDTDGKEVASAEPAAPAEDTAEQIAARIEASMSPLDYRLKLVTCNEALSAARRAREGTFDADLTAKVATSERLDFIKLVRGVRENGADENAVNAAQRAALPLPQRAEDSTPEYVAQTKECLALVTVEQQRQKAG